MISSAGYSTYSILYCPIQPRFISVDGLLTGRRSINRSIDQPTGLCSIEIEIEYTPFPNGGKKKQTKEAFVVTSLIVTVSIYLYVLAC
mmetsp:Transcript_17678/g.19364  ORF Transcript_17678/g.19364 Transcript_17678/m.19364 type:complete len:88 (-) Transcript_17678:164-427(-)